MRNKIIRRFLHTDDYMRVTAHLLSVTMNPLLYNLKNHHLLERYFAGEKEKSVDSKNVTSTEV